MGRWAPFPILCLILFSVSNGQFPIFGVEDGFLFDRRSYLPDQPRFTVVAPNLLRVDSPVNLYLEARGLTTPITVSITVHDFLRPLQYLQDSLTLGPENEYHTLRAIELPSEVFDAEEGGNSFVYLQVDFGGRHTERRELMVTFHAGYIFIQTDKPVYNPGDTVQCRAYVSSPSFKAFNSSITVEYKNADGLVVKQIFRSRAIDGVLADTFKLSDIVTEGTWTVLAKFDNREQNTFSSQFLVKKYVLPAFNVTLTPRKSSLSLDDTELEVEISARYLYGMPVRGTAYVVFGLEINNEKRRLPSVKQVSNLEDGVVTLSMEEIRRAYPDIQSIVGSSVYVTASVLTESGSDLVEKQKSGIKVVASPYLITFRDMPQYFKPGLPFDFTIQVEHHDGSPARGVPVKLNRLDRAVLVGSGHSRVTLNMPVEPQELLLTAETTQEGLRPEQQARARTTLLPYRPFDPSRRNFLYISAGTRSVAVGDRLPLELTIRTAAGVDREMVTHLTYLVLSKGHIVSARRLDVTGQTLTSVALTATKKMMPSFRFVAFYALKWDNAKEEVVSDSIRVDVTGGCAGGLTVGPAGSGYTQYTPRAPFSFKIRGQPGAKVNLVAVDNAVYLLSKRRFTQSKIWEVVEQGDLGCSRGGGGADALQVFTDAGLLFASSPGVRTAPRQALQCRGGARRRRSAELVKRRQQLESQYNEKLQRRCCRDGLRPVPMPYSCTRRSLYITEGWECVRAFRHCCSLYRGEFFDTQRPTTPPPPTTTTPVPPTTSPARPPTLPWAASGFDSFSQWNFRFTSSSLVPRVAMMPGRRRAMARSGGVRPRQPVVNVVEQRLEVEAVEEGGPGEEEKEEEGDYLDESDLYLRSKFYESWLWMDKKLPSAADGKDGLASLSMPSVSLPDSITEWSILAVSASRDTGFCVAEPYNVKVWKDLFVDLKLPYSVARNEQVEIKAVLHNYGGRDLHVRVVLMKTEGMCSVAFNQRHTQVLELPAGGSLVVPYTIMPMQVGKLPVEVMVSGRDLLGGDRVQKLLRVVMDGVQKTAVQSFVLNPSVHGGRQLIDLRKVELQSVVPNSLPETYVNIRGNVLADSIDNSISDDSLAALIRMPGGCVEQNLASITLPLIATLYLDRSNGWESVGVQRKAEALNYIKRGYEKQLMYRLPGDGAYPPYRKEGASTWITAYVVKVFSMAKSLIAVDKQQVCDSLLYLLKNKHNPSGSFREDNPVYSTTMTGGLHGREAETTLTAFVLIALAEARRAGIQCSGGADVDVEAAVRSTTGHLKRKLMLPLRRPYSVAISSYALALLGGERYFDPVRPLLKAAAPGGAFWPDSENSLFTLEATGYALLALVRSGHLEEAAAPFNWLNSQRRRGGGYGSTQPTMVVLQALSEYLIQRRPPEDLSLWVDVKVPGRQDLRYHFDPRTSYAARSSKAPLDQEFVVEATGNGQGILEVVTYYNQLPEVDEGSACKHFELEVSLDESSKKPPADVEKSYELSIRVRALGPRDVRMVVLDISLPSGFTPDNSDLEMLTNSVDHYINNFQVVDNLSDRGSLIIHLFKVSHRQPEVLIFRLQQNFRVGLLQPSAVTVYEYYNPERRCSQPYSPAEDKEALSQICSDDVCRCTQGDCCVMKSEGLSVPSKTRETFACNTLHHVFLVQVLSVTKSYYDKYDMKIIKVIKLGLEGSVRAGQNRVFMSHGACRDGVTLQPGSQYLVMGPRGDLWDADSFIYMLGKNTWVERWPSPAECSSSPTLQATCTALLDAAADLFLSGCRQ